MTEKSELLASVEEVTTAVVEFDKVQAGIAALREQYANVIFPVETTKGMADAKEARQAIRQPRYEVERIRKEAKAPILALGRQLDAKAKEITAALLAIEKPIDNAIKAEEARKEEERQAKIRAEQERVERIQEKLERIRSLPVQAAGRSSDEVRAQIEKAESIEIGDDYEEFADQARSALEASLTALRGILTERIAHEEEQARIQAEREELARLRAEAAEREAKERAEREAAEAKARAEREEEERKQREALEAERKKQAEAQAKIDAENKRLAEERAAFEREQAEARRREEEAKRKRQAEAEAERKRQEEALETAKRAEFPGEDAIIAVLCKHFSVPADVARSWIAQIGSETKAA